MRAMERASAAAGTSIVEGNDHKQSGVFDSMCHELLNIIVQGCLGLIGGMVMSNDRETDDGRNMMGVFIEKNAGKVTPPPLLPPPPPIAPSFHMVVRFHHHRASCLP